MTDNQNEPSHYVYTGHPRTVIRPLLERKASVALDVGCGFGSTLVWLKNEGWCDKTIGIEISDEAATVARRQIDEVYQGNIEQMDPPIAPNSVDLILCLDVLEHLTDPWSMLKKLHGMLAPGGTLIVTLPNIQHFSVVLPLLFLGKWPYASSGLLDRTHLRFFTRKSITSLIEDAGFCIEIFTDAGIRRLFRVLSFFTGNLIKPLVIFQYMVRARKQ